LDLPGIFLFQRYGLSFSPSCVFANFQFSFSRFWQ
jgi:hypothetical protein